jgi:hypothetical protein
MDKDTKIGLVVIIIVAIVASAYYLGKNSTIQTLSTSTEKTTTSNIEQNKIEQPVSQSRVSHTLTTASENGLACKNIANAAANIDDAQQKRTDPYGSVTVRQTHYNQSLSNCYYELTVVSNGTIETDLKAAPDDSMLVWCADISSNGQTSTICNEPNHQGLETEARFKQLENYYLSN